MEPSLLMYSRRSPAPARHATARASALYGHMPAHIETIAGHHPTSSGVNDRAGHHAVLPAEVPAQLPGRKDHHRFQSAVSRRPARKEGKGHDQVLPKRSTSATASAMKVPPPSEVFLRKPYSSVSTFRSRREAPWAGEARLRCDTRQVDLRNSPPPPVAVRPGSCHFLHVGARACGAGADEKKIHPRIVTLLLPATPASSSFPSGGQRVSRRGGLSGTGLLLRRRAGPAYRSCGARWLSHGSGGASARRASGIVTSPSPFRGHGTGRSVFPGQVAGHPS